MKRIYADYNFLYLFAISFEKKCPFVCNSENYTYICSVKKKKNMTKIIIEDGRQRSSFVAYALKSVVVKSYPPALFLPVAKNPYTHFVYPKLFRRKQNIQNTRLEDWIKMVDKQLIMRKCNTITQEANFDRKVHISKSYLQFAEDAC